MQSGGVRQEVSNSKQRNIWIELNALKNFIDPESGGGSCAMNSSERQKKYVSIHQKYKTRRKLKPFLLTTLSRRAFL